MDKTLPDYPEFTISDCGDVFKSGIKINLSVNHNGYAFFNVYNSITHKNKIIFVHRAVAELFCQNPNKYNVVNHIDGNKLNNTCSNLEWCTLSYNCKHAASNGLHTLPKGEECSWAKLNKEQVLEIRSKYIPKKYSQRKLAKEYNVSKATIQQIIENKIWI